jgi:hypothetical protein
MAHQGLRVGGRKGTDEGRMGRISWCAPTWVACAWLASCAPPAPPPGLIVTSAYDGVYTGTSVMEASSQQGCRPGSAVVLTVAKGYATLNGADDRTGWVASDGSLKMAGISSGQKANVDGSFKNGGFFGVSSYHSSLLCQYNWMLKRS